MQVAARRLLHGLLVVLVGTDGPAASNQAWQADLQIRTLEVTKTKTTLSARVVMYTENDDDARDTHLLILLPLGVSIERLPAGCAALPGPPRVPSLRATVLCDVGAIPDRGYREVQLTTSLPDAPLPRRFGVFAYSATPDPNPGNNYAERTIP